MSFLIIFNELIKVKNIYKLNQFKYLLSNTLIDNFTV